MVGKVVDQVNKVDDKDKKGVAEHLESGIDNIQKKAADVVKTADKVANSPEVNAAGTLLGPDAKDVIKTG